jgi:hypothetical protein
MSQYELYVMSGVLTQFIPNSFRSISYFWPYEAKHFISDNSTISAADTSSSCPRIVVHESPDEWKISSIWEWQERSKSHALDTLRGDLVFWKTANIKIQIIIFFWCFPWASNFRSHIKGGAQNQGVWKLGAEGNIWIQGGESAMIVQKIA